MNLIHWSQIVLDIFWKVQFPDKNDGIIRLSVWRCRFPMCAHGTEPRRTKGRTYSNTYPVQWTRLYFVLTRTLTILSLSSTLFVFLGRSPSEAERHSSSGSDWRLAYGRIYGSRTEFFESIEEIMKRMQAGREALTNATIDFGTEYR